MPLIMESGSLKNGWNQKKCVICLLKLLQIYTKCGNYAYFYAVLVKVWQIVIAKIYNFEIKYLPLHKEIGG